MMIALFVCVIAAILFAVKKFSSNVEEGEATGLAKFFANKWYIDEVYDSAIVKPITEIGDVLKKFVEKAGLVALVGGVGIFSARASQRVRALQNGNVGFYILMIIVGVTLGIGIFFIDYFIK